MPEYWRFDPTGGQYYDAPLAGDTLTDGKYKPIEIVSESETRHWGYSPVLELEVLVLRSAILRLRDPLDRNNSFLTPMSKRGKSRPNRQGARRAANPPRPAPTELEAELRHLRGE